jgi:hypothetical protein
MINYTFEISNLSTTDQYIEKPNMVTGIMLMFTGIDDTDNISGTMYSVLGLTPNEGEFIPFENLTDEIVRSWIDENDPRIERLREMVSSTIQQKRDATRILPATDMKTPPWVPEPVVSETSSSNTATNLTPTSFDDVRITALIYQVLDEIEASKT